MKQFFKTDGIRGIYPSEINETLAFQLGYALHLLHCKRVILGHDSRYSGLKLCDGFEKGVRLSGMDCILIGLATTPQIQYESKRFSAFGVMMTASHNPACYNGIKIFKNGEKLSKNEEKVLEEALTSFSMDYETYLASHRIETAHQIVLDAGHGGCSDLLKKIFKDENYHLLNTDYTGWDINLKCGSLYPEELKKAILDGSYDYGFAFDEDADRVVGCDRIGHFLNGECLAYIIASYYHYPSMVLTKMSNQGFIHSLEKKGIKVFLSEVGDKEVSRMMDKYNIALGAEASGHIIHKIHGKNGDGILNALEIIKILNQTPKKMEDYWEELTFYPAELRNYLCEFSDYEIQVLYELLAKEYPGVYPYLRMSGTEKCFRVYLQAASKEEIDACFAFLEDELCKRSS